MFTALGTWHACTLAAPWGMARGAYAACWGRGDYGQLGAPAPERCTVDGRSVPCARTPVHGPELPEGMGTLQLGDLFSCLSTGDGIKCWGANRDAFFGKRGSCPESLRRAWPTLGGSVPAPDAACSATPVTLSLTSEFEPNFQVTPRGVCLYGGPAGVRCLGAIPLPRDRRIRGFTPSLGSDASACGISGDDVICWGERYAPPGAPVRIPLQAAPPLGETAVVGDPDPSRWRDGCIIRSGCRIAPAPLPACAPRADARDWADVLPGADSLAGKNVSVRGRLGVGALTTTLVACSGPGAKPCCNTVSAPVVLGGGAPTLTVDGFGCAGDESRACCNAAAYGQSVVATGRLERLRALVPGRDSGWVLRGATLCTEASASAPAKGQP